MRSNFELYNEYSAKNSRENSVPTQHLVEVNEHNSLDIASVYHMLSNTEFAKGTVPGNYHSFYMELRPHRSNCRPDPLPDWVDHYSSDWNFQDQDK